MSTSSISLIIAILLCISSLAIIMFVVKTNYSRNKLSWHQKKMVEILERIAVVQAITPEEIPWFQQRELDVLVKKALQVGVTKEEIDQILFQQ